jgi:hypothetical protein
MIVVLEGLASTLKTECWVEISLLVIYVCAVYMWVSSIHFLIISILYMGPGRRPDQLYRTCSRRFWSLLMGAPKQKWTAEEEAALKAGVIKHGAGKWRTILTDPEFSGILHLRSNVDLKVSV